MYCDRVATTLLVAGLTLTLWMTGQTLCAITSSYSSLVQRQPVQFYASSLQLTYTHTLPHHTTPPHPHPHTPTPTHTVVKWETAGGWSLSWADSAWEEGAPLPWRYPAVWPGQDLGVWCPSLQGAGWDLRDGAVWLPTAGLHPGMCHCEVLTTLLCSYQGGIPITDYSIIGYS